VLAVGIIGLALVPGAANAAKATTFCNGELPPGNYNRVEVNTNQVCFADGGVHIRKGLVVHPGATFVFGNESSPQSGGIIDGGVYSDHGANVQIHFTTINGVVSLIGGSGPFYEFSPFCFGSDCITWQTIEDSTINGNVSIVEYNGFWHGFFRNQVHGSMLFSRNVVPDSDGNEIQSSAIGGNLRCAGNSPAPQQGDSGGSPNTVGGRVYGQCQTIVGPAT
jgi:hypothetical protein